MGAKEARDALETVEAACAPADEQDLLLAFAWLTSVTTGDKLRVNGDDGKTLKMSIASLTKAMMEYPAFAGLGAVQDWPKTEGGKWWPTENELRRLAEARAQRRLGLRNHLRWCADKGAPQEPRQGSPHGRSEAFVRDVTAAFGPAFIYSWLSGVTCQFQEHIIWTSDIGAERLRDRCSGLIAKHRVEVRVDAASKAHFERNVAAFCRN